MFTTDPTKKYVKTNKPQTEDSKKFTLSRHLAVLSARCMLPLTIIDKPAFKFFLNAYNVQNYPTGQNVADTALLDIYTYFKNETINMLKNSPNHIGLTLDCWTDSHKRRAYVVYRAHFTINFSCNVLTLKTCLLPHPHTAQKLIESIESTLEEYNLNEKKITCVTDNGSNIVKALRILKIHRLSCTAHNLHLFLTKDILGNSEFSVLNDIIFKLKQIYKTLMFRYDDLKQYVEIHKENKFLDALNDVIDIDELNDNSDQFLLNGDEDNIPEK